MRWLIYATNGFGVGHVVRTLSLARQIRKRAPESQFLFLTDSEATNLIWREGFTSVKTLPAEAVRAGRVEVGTKYALNQALVATTFAAYRPHVMVVDTFPAGRTEELLGILRNDARRILICREQTKAGREWTRVRDLIGVYELVLIPHAPGEVEIAAPPHVTVESTGAMMIRSREEALPRAEARRRLGLPQDRFTVFVGFGGGGDARYQPLLESVLQAAADFPDWLFAVVDPPLLGGPLRLPDAANVTAIRYFPLAEVWSAFDGAVSALGTNTTMEVLHNGVPTVFVAPRRNIDDDQDARLKRIVAAGAGWAAGSLDRPALARSLSQLADADARTKAGANAAGLVPRNGAEYAADFVLEFLKKPQARPGAKGQAGA
jgi:UDP:flavonoid glycosyltransferase YjiC (YdhE family)